MKWAVVNNKICLKLKYRKGQTRVLYRNFPALLKGSTDYSSDKIEMLFDANARTMAEISSCDQQLFNQEIAKCKPTRSCWFASPLSLAYYHS